MMTKLGRLCALGWFLCTINFTIFAQTPEGFWIKQAASTGLDIGNAITYDAFSNSLLLAGRFNNEFHFDGKTAVSKGGNDIFVAKIDTSGTLQWMNYGGGPGNDRPYGIASDAYGNTVVVGAMDGEITLGHQKAYAVGGSNNDFLMAKFGPHGNLLWLRNGGSDRFDQGYDVTIGSDGGYYACGWFLSTARFDADTVKSNGQTDLFVIKYDPAGNVQWVRGLGGAGNERAYGIAADGEGRLFVAGYTDSTFVGPDGVLEPFAYDDILVACLTEQGEWQWAKTFGSYGRDHAFSIAVDPQGNPIVAGRFASSFRRDGHSIRALGEEDIFVAKLSPSGRVIWMKSAGSNTHDYAFDVNVDYRGNIYLTGGFGSQGFFGNQHLDGFGEFDAFIAKMSPIGAMQWVRQIGSRGNDLGWSLAPSRTGAVYITGEFRNTAYVDNDSMQAVGSSDLFLAKMTDPLRKGHLMPQVEDSLYIARDYWIEFEVDSIENLSEIRFDLKFSNPNYIKLARTTKESILPGDFFNSDVELQALWLDDGSGLRIHAKGKSRHISTLQKRTLAKLNCTSSDRMPFDSKISYTLENFFALDEHNNVIYLNSKPDSTTFKGVNVWPGDTNNDNIVDESDLLRLGHFWGQNGYVRPSPSLVWRSQMAVPWYVLPGTFVDTNGDGRINQDDARAIGLNWQKTTSMTGASLNKFIASAPQTEPAFYSLRIQHIPQDPNRVRVIVNTENTENLFGISFGLSYKNARNSQLQQFQPVALFGGDVVHLQKHENENQVAWIGLSLKNGSRSIQSAGAVAVFDFINTNPAQIPSADDFELVELKANDAAGYPIVFERKRSTQLPTEVQTDASIPVEFALRQNTPNPFNPTTKISYALPAQNAVKIVVLDELGRHVKTLFDGPQKPGYHSVIWDGKNVFGEKVASGLYIYQILTNTYKTSKKMILLR